MLAGGFVFEVISLGVAIRSLWHAKDGRTVRESWRDTRDPTLVTVVCEDSAALTSLLIAAGGITLAAWTGSVVWDAAASMLIGTILLGVAVFLAFQNYSLLLGETAPPHVERRIRRVVEAREVRGLQLWLTTHRARVALVASGLVVSAVAPLGRAAHRDRTA